MNTKQTLKSIVNRVLLPILVLAPVLANATAVRPRQDQRDIAVIPGGTGVFESFNLIQTIAIVIRWALGFIGIIIFLIFLFAGFQYATAGGDSSKAEEATSRIVNAVIGLIIVFFAFVASNAVLSFIFQ
jgi:hypothetical protein